MVRAEEGICESPALEKCIYQACGGGRTRTNPMCKGGPNLKFDRASRIERWGVATNEEIQAAVKSQNLVWLDVRTPNETAEKPIPVSLKAKHCTVTMFTTKALSDQAPTLLPSKTNPILIFCSGGGRADEARKTLQKLGYTGTITNGGMPEDLQEAIPEFMEAAAKRDAKKGGSCVVC